MQSGQAGPRGEPGIPGQKGKSGFNVCKNTDIDVVFIVDLSKSVYAEDATLTGGVQSSSSQIKSFIRNTATDFLKNYEIANREQKELHEKQYKYDLYEELK
eukprot:UC4_evm1s922